MTRRLVVCLVALVRTASADPAPALDADSALSIDELAQPVRPEHEQILVELIANTPDSEVEEKSDYYFRLGQFYAARFHATHDKADLLRAVKTYKGLVDNDAFRNYPKLDTALFDYGYTLQSGKYMKEARAVYDKLLKNFPNSKYVPEAHLAFGEYFFDAGELADADARYAMVLKFPKSSVYWYAMYKRGWVYLRLQRAQDALEAFFQVAQATKTDAAHAALHRAADGDFVRAYAEVGKPDKALATFRRVDSAAAEDMLGVFAELEAARGKLDAAAATYRELVKLAAKTPSACRWQTRLVAAVAGTADEPHEADALVAMPQCSDALEPAQKQQVAEAALRTWQSAVPADAPLAAPPKRIAAPQALSADEQAALAKLDQLADALPAGERPRARLVEAAIYRKHHHHDEAIAILTELVRHDRDSDVAELAADMWLDSLLRLHRFDAALELADELAADKAFLTGKPTLAGNIAFLRSRSLR
jgi:tetratricopeptide (TPR) repeat protein